MHCCLRVAIVIMQVAYNLKIEAYFVYVSITFLPIDA